jgi:hypothetical protein
MWIGLLGLPDSFHVKEVDLSDSFLVNTVDLIFIWCEDGWSPRFICCEQGWHSFDVNVTWSSKSISCEDGWSLRSFVVNEDLISRFISCENGLVKAFFGLNDFFCHTNISNLDLTILHWKGPLRTPWGQAVFLSIVVGCQCHSDLACLCSTASHITNSPIILP